MLRKMKALFLIMVLSTLAFSVTARATAPTTTPTPTTTITEADVQTLVDSQGVEKITGNILIWFLCAIAFLKISQRFDSYMSALGVNVGQTGNMYAEMMVAGKALSMAMKGGGGKSFGGKSGSDGGGLLAGGLAGFVGRQVNSSSVASATGQGGNPLTNKMFESSLAKDGGFANDVIGKVAKGDMSKVGSITGDKATAAFNSYFPSENPTQKSSSPSETSTGKSSTDSLAGYTTNSSESAPKIGSESAPNIESMSEPTSVGGANDDLGTDSFATTADMPIDGASASTEGATEIGSESFAGSGDGAIESVASTPEIGEAPLSLDSSSVSEIKTVASTTTDTHSSDSVPTSTNSEGVSTINTDSGKFAEIGSAPFGESVATSGAIPSTNTDSTSSVSTVVSSESVATQSGSTVYSGSDVSVSSSSDTSAISETSSISDSVSISESSATTEVSSGSVESGGISDTPFTQSVASESSTSISHANSDSGMAGGYVEGATVSIPSSIDQPNSFASTESIPAPPVHSNIEIGGGRISGIETSEQNSGGIEFGMYNTDQYAKPSGDFNTVQAIDGSKWYKQYAVDTVKKTPFKNEEGKIEYKQELVKQMPPIPRRKDKI